MLDALQATRPFYPELFKGIMKEFHLKFTDFISKIWNKRILEFDVV